jgi:hypothetical protein
MSSLQKFHRRTNAGVANTPPVVGSVLVNQSASVGGAFNYTFASNSFSDADIGDVLTYSASGMPTGITFDAQTRTFGGSTNSEGTFTITVTAKDKANATASQSFTLTVTLYIGAGNNTTGYYAGKAVDGVSKMWLSPASTQNSYLEWGSQGTTRNTASTTDGLANTNTLISFGTAAHPAAGYCKYLSTGGYNTWYLPAIDEMLALYSVKTPLSISSSQNFWTSSESLTNAPNNARTFNFSSASFGQTPKNGGFGNVPTRAIRRS